MASSLQTRISEQLKDLETRQFVAGPAVENTGISIAVIENGRVILKMAQGWSDREKRESVTTDTVFPIASITKSFTAAALVQCLLRAGKPGPGTRVRDLDPKFGLHAAEAAEKATFVDLLSHRTGLPRHDSLWMRTELESDELVKRLPRLEMNPANGSGFGGSFQYNNLLYGVCGRSAAKLAGVGWHELIEAEFLRPLGMDSTWSEFARVPKDRQLAQPYFREARSPFFERWRVAPAASLFSTAESLARWLLLQLGRGELDGKRVLPKDLFEKWLWKPWNDAVRAPEGQSCFTTTQYGLGWFIDAFLGHRLIHHGGSINGLSALASFMPERGLGVVVLVNQVQSRLPRLVTQAVLCQLMGVSSPPEDRFQPIPIYSPETIQPIYPAAAAEPAPATAAGAAAESAGWPDSAMGKYSHPGYGELSVKRDGSRLEFQYGVEKWPADVVSETAALAQLTLIGMPCTMKITLGARGLEVPFNLAQGNLRTVFTR